MVVANLGRYLVIGTSQYAARRVVGEFVKSALKSLEASACSSGVCPLPAAGTPKKQK
jgi:hypothetical protein